MRADRRQLQRPHKNRIVEIETNDFCAVRVTLVQEIELL